uniref:Calponin-homology (CH) domain-containing protein n=1 Tax=Bursaphelenchus xylophilus TaxID=6326 RepID=A0A1I7SG23_BURXY
MKFFCVPLFACKGQLVESLDFSGKNLSDLPKEVIKAKKTLEELNLRMNFIEVLPQELFRCARLKKLDVSENRIKNLPEEISLLGDLMVLNLSKNDLVNLPDQIGQCVNLVSLNLSNNMLSLSKSVMNLTQLTTLNISETSTTTLPAEIDQLVNLQHLDASQCDISSLPNSIVRLSKLKVLDLCENHITELPAQMDKMLSLESLDVRANMLTKIPDKLLQCRELQTLDLSQNNLLDLPNDLGELDKMVELVLCENSLSSLPHSLGNMKRLEVLKITKNALKTLTPAICRCVNLTDLYLSENLLEKTKPAPQPPRPTSSLGNKSFEDVAAEVQAANPAISNVEFVDRMDQPLATSSPVPPKSRIPVKNAANSNNNQQTLLNQQASSNGHLNQHGLNQHGSNAQIRPPSQSRTSSGIHRPTSSQSNPNGHSRLPASHINPPPLAPKPQLTSLPERMDFDSKRRHFEQRINQEKAGPSQERPAHPPPKRPLVSGQEVVNNKEVSMDKIPMIDEEAGSSMDRDIQDLLNGNLNIPKQPRQNGNQPNDRLNGLRNQSMDCPSPAPSDISTVSSVLEQRAADFEKQQALRQAKLHSMHKESMEAADLVKLIDRFANSPIPTQ